MGDDCPDGIVLIELDEQPAFLLCKRYGPKCIDKLTYRLGLALPDGGLNALYIDVSSHSEPVMRLKDA